MKGDRAVASFKHILTRPVALSLFLSQIVETGRKEVQKKQNRKKEREEKEADKRKRREEAGAKKKLVSRASESSDFNAREYCLISDLAFAAAGATEAHQDP